MLHTAQKQQHLQSLKGKEEEIYLSVYLSIYYLSNTISMYHVRNRGYMCYSEPAILDVYKSSIQ